MSIMEFPYEIRKIPVGQLVVVPNGEDTVCWSVEYKNPFAKRPEDRFRSEGAQLPTMSGHGWLIHSLAISCVDDDKEVLFAMAKESLDSLPDLKYKFMLVYNTGATMFWSCFLVATDNEHWWREYEGV